MARTTPGSHPAPARPIRVSRSGRNAITVAYVNSQGLTDQAGGFFEQLLQVAANQRVLAQRGYDRLLKSIVVARIAGISHALVDHRRFARVR